MQIYKSVCFFPSSRYSPEGDNQRVKNTNFIINDFAK